MPLSSILSKFSELDISSQVPKQKKACTSRSCITTALFWCHIMLHQYKHKLHPKAKQCLLELRYKVTLKVPLKYITYISIWHNSIRSGAVHKKAVETKVFWRYYQKGWLTDWVNELMNDKAVCRTAPASPGL